MKGPRRGRDGKLQGAVDQFLSLGVPESTPEHEVQVREALENDAENKRKFNEVADAWRALDLARNSPEVLDTLARYGSNAVHPEPRRWTKYLVAASVLMFVGVSIALFSNGRSNQSQTYQTRLAEQSIALLADGSTMHLNARSAVQVDYSSAQRHVKLIDGEATFRVEHDATRPFLVIVDGVSVRAVGTEFNVRREHDSLTVAVLDGVVEVTGSANDLLHQHPWRQQLPLGRVLKMDRATSAVKVEVATADIARIKGWQAGRLVFQSEPLHSVVKAVNRNIDSGPIVIADPAIRDLPVNMNFDIKQSKDFVSALLLGFPVEAEYLSSGEIRLRAKSDIRPGA
ncbi:MAG TPA: FecR domain-containing protein [Steroidobacter sp.]|uniref:FecR family protein n=1 Tax=Steroidobacter sp. TaxID=1978227 RepID=UPI002EDA1234